jgi:hypothetical protein
MNDPTIIPKNWGLVEMPIVETTTTDDTETKTADTTESTDGKKAA